MHDVSNAGVVVDLLQERIRACPDAEAAVFPDERLTWSALAARAETLACALIALGVRPRDNVAVMLPNSAGYAVAVFAIAMAGACTVPVNLRFKETELSHLLADSDATVLLSAGRTRHGSGISTSHDLLSAVLPDLAGQKPHDLHLESAPKLRVIAWLDGEAPAGALDYDQVIAAAREVGPDQVARRSAETTPRDLAMIMYTSGTTARPKGVMITHEAVVAQARCIGVDCYRLTADDRFWTPLPMFHTGGLMSLLACVATGAAYCHAGVFEAGAALRQLERERITVAMPTFEPLWLPVLDHPDFEKTDLSRLRIVQTAGVPEKQRLMQARLPTAVNMQSSGMTESTSYFAFNRPEDPPEVRLSTGGYALPTVEVRVVDPETGLDAAPGQHGETWLRGVACFVGYYNAPELTAEAIDADGWFHTGDMGVLDTEGRYTFVGRIKDMLKVGGENVAAAEVEDYLSRHPAVRLAQVVAAPDRRYSEVPAAFIELNEGARGTERELIEFCLGKIATYKVPRYIRFVTEWPMSGTKIQKFRLREQIAKELKERGIQEAPRLVATRGGSR